MKKVFWWIFGILLTPLLLFVILVVLFYLPPIQNWAVEKVTAIVSEKTGMQISIGHVQLSFPLDLSIENFKMIAPPSSTASSLPEVNIPTEDRDTIADVERLVVDVQLWPLLHKKVIINELEVTNTKLNTNGFVDAAQVKGSFKRLFVTSKGIDLDQQMVELNGTRLEEAQVSIVIRDSVPEDTTKTETLWKIHADSLAIVRSEVILHMPGDTMSIQAQMSELKAHEAFIDLTSQTYTVNNVDWIDGELRYDQNILPPIDGLDFNHLDLTSINIGIDSIYYHDPSLRFFIRQMGLKEKSSLEVTNITGAVAMEDGSLKLPRFHLKMPSSDVLLSLDMPLSLTDSIDPGRMKLRMDAQLGRQDLLPFMSLLPPAMQERWPHYQLSLKGQLDGNMDYMEFSDLDVVLPTAFAVKADGFVTHLNDMKQLRADVQFEAQTQNLDFVMAVLPRDVQKNYRFPPLKTKGRAKADGAQYNADVTVYESNGAVKLKGSLNKDVMSYDAKFEVDNLNVHHFMPHDSIYTVTADLTVSGKGTDFLLPRTTLNASGRIDHLRYGHLILDSIALKAQVRNGRANVDIDSHNALLDGLVGLDFLMNPRQLEGTLTADVNEVDLYKFGVVDNPLSIGLCGHVDVSSDMKTTHSVNGFFNDLTLRDSLKTYRPKDIGLLLKTRPDTTYMRVQTGDFIVKLDASGYYEPLLEKLTLLDDSVMSQIEQKIINQSAIRSMLPEMKVHVESKNDNPVAALLKAGQEITFKDLLFDLTSSPVDGLNGNGYIHALTFNEVRLDTINFRLSERNGHLSFGGQVCNNKKNPDFVFNALFDGLVQERGATLGVRYFDASNKLGVRIGAQAEMVDSGIRLHLVPEHPTIGYKEFNLNKDNYILLTPHHKIETKIDLVAYDGAGVKIYSEDDDPSYLQDITISLNKVNLGEVSSVLPYMPSVTGLLDGDYHIVQDAEGNFSVVSDMTVQNMSYEKSFLGNLSTEMVYLQKENDAHAIEARLMKDEQEIGQITGTYYHQGEGSLDAVFKMKHLPLSLVNGFIPDHIIGLQGYGDGELAIKGKIAEPHVDGEIYLDSSYIESVPYGVTMRFDNDPMRIVDSKLLFENFAVYAYNNNPLNVQGNVDFSHLDHMKVDLRMRAQNFQIIGAEENPQSIVYGKTFVNVLASMRGPVDDLTMRGRLEVLGSTDMNYVLRDSPLATDNRLNELVKFTDFSDTAQVIVERPSLNGFRMDMTVDVSTGAHIMAYLNTDHSNYIDLMGGGTLRMQYSPSENLRMTGRYTLSNGEMKYSLHIIPLKTFTIQDGSYIEFTGDVMNPTLNITATERTKANVTDNSGVSRSVLFDCGVKITKTLNDMGVEFTLDAPEDLQLHGELMAMGVEQRGKLAVTMLTTGMYLNSDGSNTGSFTMNSALGAFLNSEIHSITGNALRTLDLSFGMDKATDASGQNYTDYSFKFAKRFMDNRLKISVGGLVSTGASYQQRNNSFFDNVSLEYRLNQTANKFITVYYQNNAYDWLDGYMQKYGAGFTWRRSLQSFWDIFRFKDTQDRMHMRPMSPESPNDTTKVQQEKEKNK